MTPARARKNAPRRGYVRLGDGREMKTREMRQHLRKLIEEQESTLAVAEARDDLLQWVNAALAAHPDLQYPTKILQRLNYAIGALSLRSLEASPLQPQPDAQAARASPGTGERLSSPR